MIVQYTYDSMSRLEKPNIYLCTPAYSRQYAFGSVSNNVILTLRFNAVSELSFTIPRVQNVGTDFGYDSIKNKKIIELQGVGYFIITNVEEDKQGFIDTKKVTAQSVEMELGNKRILAFSGTYPLHDPIDPTAGLLGKILATYAPNWTIDVVDGALLTKYRTFTNVNDTTVYNFLMSDVETSYGCVFSFDTVYKKVSARTIANATTKTDIFISFDNLLKTGTFSELSDEITTVMYCYGAGDMDIRSVNPLGTTKIYDFSYYMTLDWMSQDLIDAINAWTTLIDDNQAAYAGLITSKKTKNGELIALQGDLIDDQGILSTKQDELKVMVNAGWGDQTNPNHGTYWDKWTEVNVAEANVVADQIAVDNKQAEIAATTVSIVAINDLLAFDANFTVIQLSELNNCIYENTYQNQNIIQSDTMTLVETQEAAQSLYDQSKEVLAKVAQPRYEFTANTVNFPFIKDYYYFTQQLEAGATMMIDMTGQGNGLDRTLIETVVLEIVLNYDKPEDLGLTFSNRLRLDNGKFVYSDLVGQTVKTGSSVNFGELPWGDWNKNYKGDVSKFITSALDASKNAVINASSQEIIIDEHGLRGRKLLDPGIPGVYSPKQCWLTNTILAFTDNNWENAKLALGEISTPGGSMYGLCATAIFGNLIAGNNLIIENEGATFTVNGTGATLTNADFTVTSTGGNSKILISPLQGFRIQKNVTGSWVDQFYADNDGNVIFTGTLSGNAAELTTGHIGGLVIDAYGLHTPDSANYILSNGNLHWGNLDITGSTATFDGNIYANNLKTTGGDPVFTGDTMVGDFVYGGSLHGPHITIEMGGAGLPRIVADNGIELIVSAPSPAAFIEIVMTANDPILGNWIGFGQGDASFALFSTGLDITGIPAIKVNATESGFTTDFVIGGNTLHFIKGILTSISTP